MNDVQGFLLHHFVLEVLMLLLLCYLPLTLAGVIAHSDFQLQLDAAAQRI